MTIQKYEGRPGQGMTLTEKSTGLALSPAQPVDAVGQGATCKSCDGSGYKSVAGFGIPFEDCNLLEFQQCLV